MSWLFDAIIRGAIAHRQLVIAFALALLGFAVWLGRDARLDALPNFTPSVVVVQTEAPGLGSLDVEELVTNPLERALLGIPRVTRIRSTSSPGLSVVQMTFEEGVDIFRARQLVSERIADARETLNQSLPQPRLAPITAPVGSLIKLTYTTAGGTPEELAALTRFAEWQLRPRLAAIEGVSRVTVHGGPAPRIEIVPRAASMLARDVTLRDLVDGISRGESLTPRSGLTPLGFVRDGPMREPIRAPIVWSWKDVHAIEATVVGMRDGLPVRVADVASVREGHAPAVGAASYDGKPAIYVQVEKLPWADTLRLTEEVERALAELDDELPEGAVRNTPTFRQSDFVHTSIRSLARAMALGALFVVAILIALLRSPRLAVISLTALPLSIAAAIAVLLSAGTTLNGMILGGLAVAVGEVVDDAIVDVENIWRRLRDNRALEAPRSALAVIHDASREVRGTVVYASSIVVAVLTPIMVLGGLTGRIFSPLAETYALAVVASLAVALTVTPALAALLLPRLADRAPSPTRLSLVLSRAYDGALRMVRRAPGRVVVMAAVLGLGALCAAPFIGGAFLPELREGVLIAAVTAPAGTSLEETMRLAGRIDETLRNETDVRHVAARAGRASLDEDAAPVNRLEIDLVLPKDAEPEEIASEISARLADIAGVRFGVEGFLGERINELLSGERAPIALKLRGDDLAALRVVASSLVRRMEGIEEIRDVRASGLSDVPTTDLRTDDTRLAVHGLSRTELVDTVAAYHQGLEVASVATPGGFFAPVVLAGTSRDAAATRLADVPVSTASAVLPLSRFAELAHGAEPPVVDHEAGQRLLTVTATTRPGDTSVAADRVEAMMREVAPPPGVSLELAGQAAERKTASTRLVLTVALVLLAVFAFLWMAFRSLVDAAVVLLGLPLGLVGGVVAALLIPEGLSMAGLVGFVALFGIISRNGIMLVAHKNQLLGESGGALTEEIVLAAARERLLPIAMTAATAFFGLLPLAASLGAPGSELEAPMAVVVCAGLVTSTALNLLAVPAFYLWRAGRRRGGSAPEVER